MDQRKLVKLLDDLPVGPVRYLSQITSTNDLAADWARRGAPDASLLVADEQTAGRGRGKRRWFTPPGAALAFSLVLRGIRPSSQSAYPGLGALAICQALEQDPAIRTRIEIKWPNDVLAGGKKLAGVLSEAQWLGDQPEFVILGIGINIAPTSVPPAAELSFPATCVEAVAEAPYDRWMLLKEVLARLLYWRDRVGSPQMIREWEARLAFMDQPVRVYSEGQGVVEGRIIALEPEGSLKLRLRSGETSVLHLGEIRLRPVDRRGK